MTLRRGVMIFSTIAVLGLEAGVIADKFRSNVQRNAQILAEELRQGMRQAALLMSRHIPRCWSVREPRPHRPGARRYESVSPREFRFPRPQPYRRLRYSQANPAHRPNSYRSPSRSRLRSALA